ncbi:MAG: rod shape-determining protein RodA [Ignavibacteriales bacterium]|nr:rod shape-determining protein RodA [Ignavibacteriales bacterium]
MLLRRRSRIDYQFEDKFDILLVGSALLLIVIGLLAIYSSTLHHPTAGGNFYKQLYSAILALVVFFIVYFIPTRIINLLPLPSYLFSILFLIAVIFIGRRVYGSKSWLDFGPFGFQPSEFAKIGVIFLLSYFLSRDKTNIESIKDIVIALLIGTLPIILILLQPDVGTTFVFAAIILTLLYWKGISLFGLFVVLSPPIVVLAYMFGTTIFIAVLVLVILALIYFKKNLFLSASLFVINLSAGFFFESVYNIMSPHQQRRIATFLDPTADPLGSGYNAIQARVAIGSGGFFGKGFLSGNQTQLRFIPEQWTDFIFCVIGEEFGFIGSVITISLFLFVFLRLLKITWLAKEKSEFHSLLVVGILTLLFFHFVINIGMTIGIMPVVGLPLPFLSFGGSSLLVNMFLIGVAANIYRNRKQYT